MQILIKKTLTKITMGIGIDFDWRDFHTGYQFLTKLVWHNGPMWIACAPNQYKND